jgi:hypothetical protein
MKGEIKLIIKGKYKGHRIRIEDTWENISGRKIMDSCKNFSELNYHKRVNEDNLPLDDNVYYGKIDHLGYIVHASELE